MFCSSHFGKVVKKNIYWFVNSSVSLSGICMVFSLNLYLLLNVSSKMKSYLFKNIFSILPCSSSSSREARDPSYLLQNVCAEYQLLRCSGSFGICIKKHCLKKKINRRFALFSFCLRALPINENVESTALGDAPRFKFILVMTAF